MKIITRYIFTEALTYFLISLFAFTGLLLVGRILRFTNLIVNKGVEVGQIAMVFLSVIPTFMEVALPMSALLGLMLAFGRLSGDSEIVVMRASGISLHQLIKPVILFGVLCTIICFYVTLQLRPWGHRQLAQTLFEIARSKSTAGLEEGMFNKLGRMILYADTVEHQSGALKNVLIDDKRDSQRRQVIFAKTGTISSDARRRTITIELVDGVIHEESGGRYGMTDFTSNSLVINPDEMYNPDAKKGGKRHREMSLPELRDDLNSMATELAAAGEGADPETRRELERNINKARVELGRRFSMPFAAFLLALIAMPLGIQPPRAQRAWGATISISLAVLVFIFYYALMSIGVALSEGGKWSPTFGLWLPNVAVGLVAWYTVRQMSSERWQSIAHGFENFLTACAEKYFKRAAA